MRNLFYRLSIFFIYCAIVTNSKFEGKFVATLDPDNFATVVLLPEIAGDKSKLLTTLHALYMKYVSTSSLSKFDFEKMLTDSVSTSNSESLSTELSKSLPVALVTFGNVGKGLIADNIACYDMLFSVERALGWRVFPIYGFYEIALIDPKYSVFRGMFSGVATMILDRFSVAVHVFNRRRRAHALVPPNKSDMLLVNSLSGGFAHIFGKSRFVPSLLLAPKDTMRICDSRLSKYLKEFRVARLVLSDSSSSSSTVFSARCGSRLVNFSTTREAFPILPQTFWPVPVTRSTSVFPVFTNIIVIPDIHGDIEGFITSLWLGYSAVASEPITLPVFRAAILASQPLRTDAQKVIFVQLGDLIDRGPSTKECIELALSISKLFPGWKSALLAGNHELLNFHQAADYYVHPKDELQGAARSAAFSIEGSLWSRLASKLVLAVIIGRTLFVHASLDPVWLTTHASLVKELYPSSELLTSLNKFARYALLLAPDMSHVFEEDESPVWSRALENLPEEELCKTYFMKMSIALNIDRVVVGHNPQANRKVRSRCNGKVLLSDVRISKWMSTGGTPMAMHFKGEDIKAHYWDGSKITTDTL